MAESFRESVPMGLVRPSGTNPRREMGDLKALARSIEATGGQPVSPIVVVPDGGVYRIVDGERRWRAMGELGAERVDCVVVDGYDDADKLVAMMATDDKLRLSDEERARGTQRMLRLDVPEGRAAGALGSTEERVRRARRVVREAPESSRSIRDTPSGMPLSASCAWLATCARRGAMPSDGLGGVLRGPGGGRRLRGSVARGLRRGHGGWHAAPRRVLHGDMEGKGGRQ